MSELKPTNLASKGAAKPAQTPAVLNVVPPMGSAPPAPSFDSVLNHVMPALNQQQSAPKSVSGDVPTGSQERRMQVAEDIGKAVKAGDLGKLHQLQTEYDQLTVGLRSQVEAAFTAHQATATAASSNLSSLQTGTILPAPASSKPLQGGTSGSLHTAGTTPPATSSDHKPKVARSLNPTSKSAAAGRKVHPKPEAAQPATAVKASAPTSITHLHAPQSAFHRAVISSALASSLLIQPQIVLPAAHSENVTVTSQGKGTAQALHTAKTVPSQQGTGKAPLTSPPAVFVDPSQAIANPFNVSQSVWDAVCGNAKVQATLHSMPQPAIDLYRRMSLNDKKEMAKHLNEKTHVFLFTIDNRQAFISGKVMGRDTFQYIKDTIDKQMYDGKVTLEDAMRQESAIDVLGSLTPDQREGFVALVEGEVDSPQVADRP